jgi:protein TonB
VDAREKRIAMSASRELRWFLAAGLAASLLFAASVFWLRQASSGTAGRVPQAAPAVAVQLVRVPDSPAEAAASSEQPQDTAADRISAVPPAAVTSPSRAAAAHPALDDTRDASSPAQAAGETSKFQAALAAHLARFKRYPDAARERRLRGIVYVAFSLRRDGFLADVSIRKSSGEPVLDQEAIETLKRAQPLPPIPFGLPGRLEIVSPVEFLAP